MHCLFYMVVLNVRNHPNVARIFPQRIARILTCLFALVVFFSGIFLRSSNGIQIENVIARFREPENSLIAPRQTPATVQSVFEGPNNSVSQFKPEPFANSIDEYIEWKNLSALPNMIAHLPAEASVASQNAGAFLECVPLEFQVVAESDSFFILFADIVGG